MRSQLIVCSNVSIKIPKMSTIYRILSLLLVITFLMLAGAGYAAEKWALIIGVDKFDDPNVGTLKYTVNDADALYQTLTSIPNGFPRENVMLITPTQPDTDHRPTRNNIIAMLTTWLDLAETGDIILVYFSGHGLEIEAESYIVPSDTKLSNPALTAIPIEVVKDQMRRSKASKKILILDACHSGEGKATAKMGSILQRTLDDAEGMVTLASCGLNESSYEMKDKPHGAFTYFLMEALKGRGTTDRDQDGLISVSEVNRYVYE